MATRKHEVCTQASTVPVRELTVALGLSGVIRVCLAQKELRWVDALAPFASPRVLALDVDGCSEIRT